MNRLRLSPTTLLLLLGLVVLATAPGCDSTPNPGAQGCPTSLGEANSSITPGMRFPPLTADGWFNGDAPTPEELKGQVFVVDIWASWCGPCVKSIPEMIKTYDKYKDQGVRFFGLSQDESAEQLEQARIIVKRTGVAWPNGFGASTADSLGIKLIPTVFVIGRDGRVAWANYSSPGTLSDGIESALGH